MVVGRRSAADRVRDCVVLTPARNEAERLPRLAESLAAQSLRPRLWLVIENGSTDDTVDVTRSLEKKYSFAQLRQIPFPKQAPSRGGPVVHALHAALDDLPDDFGMVIKVDADVTLDERYIERLVEEFVREPELGVASGTCYEEEAGRWVQRHMTADMVWCAARAYRRSCLDAILPFAESFGWDSIDIAKAQLQGWRTLTFTDLPFQHHRAEGERDGLPGVAWANQGRGCHFLSYRPSYVAFRALNGMRRDPRAIMMIWGYISSALRRSTRYEDATVCERIRRDQRLRFLGRRVRESFGLR
jgi:biofilm PGA synthesis N-glycosyltransferase PgaC